VVKIQVEVFWVVTLCSDVVDITFSEGLVTSILTPKTMTWIIIAV
jgi:hypothetical protein